MVLIFASYGGAAAASRTGTMLISGGYAAPMPRDATDTGVHEAVAARLADRDGRYTGSRRDLIQALADAGRPLTVDEIVVRAPKQRPSSVYRNLSVFEAEGVVRRLAGVGDLARFELTEALVGHHHHLACQVCGAMTDVHLSPDLERRLERALDDVAAAEGFTLSSHVLDAVGVCQHCSRSGATRPATPPSRDR
jgi:Fur family ferric uptake transcriptional regulator